MSPEGDSHLDRDLLSRLNALKPSSIELNKTSYGVGSPGAVAGSSTNAAPGAALSADLLSRFQGISANKNISNSISRHVAAPKDDLPQPSLGDKTFEELLADLGPLDQHTFGKSEQDEVDALLKQANEQLAKQPQTGERSPTGRETPTPNSKKNPPSTDTMHGIDLSAFEAVPEIESDEDEGDPEKPKKLLRDQIDEEADEALQRLLDELKFDPPDATEDENAAQSSTLRTTQQFSSEPPPPPYSLNPSTTLPRDKKILLQMSQPSSTSTAHTAPPATSDADLEARLSSLSFSLPSAPITLPIPPATYSTEHSTSQKSTSTPTPHPGYTDEEIDTWCIICNDDANLRCIGCDGDLYCTNCWIEGHQSESAGYEERRHRAVEFVKGGRKKKNNPQRRLLSA